MCRNNGISMDDNGIKIGWHLDGIYQSDSLSVRPCDVEQQHPMGVAYILSGPSTWFVVSVNKPSFCPLSSLSPAACRLRVADHCHLLRTPISAVSVAFFVFFAFPWFHHHCSCVCLCRVHFLSSAAMAVSSCTTMTGVSSSVAALASSNSVLIHGASVVTPTRVVSVCGRAAVRSISCRAKVEAEDAVVSTEPAPALPRRLALALLAGAVVAGSRAAPANAAYGETGQLIPKKCSRLVAMEAECLVLISGAHCLVDLSGTCSDCYEKSSGCHSVYFLV